MGGNVSRVEKMRGETEFGFQSLRHLRDEGMIQSVRTLCDFGGEFNRHFLRFHVESFLRLDFEHRTHREIEQIVKEQKQGKVEDNSEFHTECND